MRLNLFGFLSVTCIIALSASIASADVYGALRGTVTDAQGQPVAGAGVVLKAPDGATQKTATGRDGRYSFPRVAFDTYSVSVSAAGFAAQEGVVTVSSGSVAALNFTLTSKVLGRIVTTASLGAPNSVNTLNQQTISGMPTNSTLNKIIESVPGIVPFSYDEPIARGYHGLLYQVDGIPLPQTTSAHFPDVVDPSYVDRLEVFTGAIPAEFGGERQGAVINIVTKRASDIAAQAGGSITLAAGSYGAAGLTLSENFGAGAWRGFLSLDENRTNRGLDSPAFAPQHDAASHGTEFLRAIYSPTKTDTFSFDFSNQYAAYQIPINTNFRDPNDPFPALAGTDDNQHEYDRFINLSYNRLSADGKGYVSFAPFYRSDRVTFLPDPRNDLNPILLSTNPQPTSAFQDRIGKYVGIAAALFRGGARHNVKLGVQASREDFSSAFHVSTLSYVDPSRPALGVTSTSFSDNGVQRGSNVGVYVQDKIDASPATKVNLGLRYDRSTGFVSGDQFSPRVEVNISPNPQDTLHLYYGRLYAAPALEDTRREVNGINGSQLGALPIYDLKPERDSILEVGVAHQFSPLSRAYVTFYGRKVDDVLDTTQLGSSPIFTVFNSSIGRADGVEFNYTGRTQRGSNYFVSYTLGESLAQGISGGTFLFPTSALSGAASFAPEDHDQTNTLNAGYTFALASDSRRFLGLQTTYGSGYPAQFENGFGRLPGHVELHASFGRRPPPDGRGFGYSIEGTNLLNHHYLIKLANGFNTTQYAAGRQISVRITAPLP